jgi:hypothetical protein
MTIFLIVFGYIIVTFIEMLNFKRNKQKSREVNYYLVFMVISLGISLFIAANEDLPSIASIIRAAFLPIVGKGS